AHAALGGAEAQTRDAHDEVARLEAVLRATTEQEFALRAGLEQSAGGLAARREAAERAAVSARRIMPGSAGARLRRVLESLNGDGPARPPAMLLDVMKAPPALEPALRAVLGE